MKNGIIDADFVSAYAEALAILRQARTDIRWFMNTDREKLTDPGYLALCHASQHLKRKQKGLWIISQLRRSSEG